MSARFRIRTSLGQELSFASHDMFAEFVRSGDLSPDDVVYDAETKEWASALTHPLVLQIQLASEEDEKADGDEADGESAPHVSGTGVHAEGLEEDPADSGPAVPPVSDLGLVLAPIQEGLSPDQEAAAFVARMDAERASQIEGGDERESSLGFRMERGTSNVLESPPEHVSEGVPEGVPETEPAPRVPRERAPDPRWESEPAPRPAARTATEPAKKKLGSGAAWKYAPFFILLSALVVGGVYFGPELFESASGGDADTDQAPVILPPPPLIPDREDAVRARARELFLTATQAALRSLDPVPEVWLRGEYLAGPSDFPIVRAVWEEYVTTIREVRSAEAGRYRAAYARALEDARVVDSLRAGRLGVATTDFGVRAPSRAAHYDRVEALATAGDPGSRRPRAGRRHDRLPARDGPGSVTRSGHRGRRTQPGGSGAPRSGARPHPRTHPRAGWARRGGQRARVGVARAARGRGKLSAVGTRAGARP